MLGKYVHVHKHAWTQYTRGSRVQVGFFARIRTHTCLGSTFNTQAYHFPLYIPNFETYAMHTQNSGIFPVF